MDVQKQTPFVFMPLGEAVQKVELAGYFEIGAFIGMMVEGAQHTDSADQLDSESIDALKQRVVELETHLDAVGMRHTLAMTDHVKKRVFQGMTWQQAGELLEFVQVSLREEINQIFVGFLPDERARFWGQERAFGDSVYNNFASVRPDVVSAGNCYAVEQYTACVFHCMRVVEKGMRALARERRIGVIKGKPLEWNDWGSILKAIRDKADDMAKRLRPGPARDMALEFYRGAAGEMESFKDTYRNYVTHDRATYDRPAALTAYHRVSEFMQRLATRLSEDQQGAIKWPKK